MLLNDRAIKVTLELPDRALITFKGKEIGIKEKKFLYLSVI